MQRLKKRRDFLAARKGFRRAGPYFVLESRDRGDSEEGRIGFTVSKRVARQAVVRNRIRRRLKEAAREAVSDRQQTGRDLVVIARLPALRADFADLVGAFSTALTASSETAHHDHSSRSRRKRRGPIEIPPERGGRDADGQQP
ncbi:ribonuclease P protein component [Afifella sp. H1R]|uniref:ribonuclease P protein component n=1 Tax=unclassified Afifella TaxID=2624128 RepID=UPI001F19B37B|nr:ribonuclease P protein component [Afifella sp. H1R]MCF1504848.1 ribonuclease P protein component [Afifella sp. H1R]